MGNFTFSFYKRAAALLVTCLLLANIGYSQYAVTVTNTSASTGLAASYTSFANAVTALNLATISGTGTITIAYSSGISETAPVSGYNITKSGTSTVSIVFDGGGKTITAGLQVAAGVMDAVFKLNGADYITIKNFVIQENPSNIVTATGATNTMTEFGVLLIHASATDGAQNNIIQDNTITLSSVYPNTVGIFSTSASTTVTGSPWTNVSTDASSTAGTNSNNSVYHNTISGAQFGIVFICPPVTAPIFETGNNIGGTTSTGSAATTGNTITFGNNSATTGPWARSVAGGKAGIMMRNGAGNTIRYNTVNSLTTLTESVSSNGVVGINISSGTAPSGVTYTSTIRDNSLTIYQVGTQTAYGIDFGHGLSTGTITGSNNSVTINQKSVTASTSGAQIGIRASYAAASSTLNTNTITINQTFTPTATTSNSSPLTGISMPTGTTGTPTMTALGNTITINRSALPTTGTCTMSGAVTGIAATQAAASTLTIGATGSGNGNTITVKEASGGAGTTTYSSAVTYVDLGSLGHGTVNVINNTFNTTGSTIKSTGALNCVNQGSTTITVAVNVKNNTVNIDRTATTGAVGFFTQTSTTPNDPLDDFSSNNITFTGLAGTTSVTVIQKAGGSSTASRTISNNTISVTGTNTGTCIGISYAYSTLTTVGGTNSITISCAAPTVTGITCTTNATASNISGTTISLTSTTTSPTAMTGILVAGAGANSITGNTITAMNFSGVVTSSPNMTGISLSAGSTNTVSGNTISGISAGAAGSSGSPTIRAILLTGGTTNNVTKNKVYNLSTNCTGNTALYGIHMTGGTTNNINNNIVGDLRMPAGQNSNGSPMSGIFVANGSGNAANVHFNTVYINGTTSGSIFYSGALYASTLVSLTSSNNILVNICTPTGSGVVAAAFYRSSTTLTTYQSASNNNLLFAGTPSASNIIFFDITNKDQTLSDFKTRVGATRDAASVTENISTTLANTSTGSSANYLHFTAGSSSAAESGGVSVSGITDDFDADTRGATPDIGADEFAGGAAPCTTPTLQPTTFVAGTNTSTTIAGSFSAPATAPSGYLVVRSSGALSGLPADASSYSAGAAVGTNGTSIQQSSSLSFTGSSLASNTTYTITIFSYNSAGCSGGPKYFTTTPLTGTLTTCPGIPTSVANSNVQANQFDLSWAAPTNGATDYTIEVTTDAGFTAHITGSPTTQAGLTKTWNLLTGATPYYYRVKANNSTCSSAWVSGNVSTTPDCANGTVLSCATDATVTIPAGSGVWSFSGTTPNNSCGFATPGLERIYRFTPTSSGTHTLTVSSVTTGYIDYFWKASSAGCNNTGWNCYNDVGAAANPVTADATMNLTAGTEYYILLDDEDASSTTTHTFRINCPCSGSPTAGTPPSNPTICSGATTTLTVAGAATGLGISYQWEEWNGTAWVNAVGGSGATTTAYTTPALSAAKQYHLKVTCSGSGLSATTSPDNTVNITPAPTVTITPASPHICGSGSVTLNATTAGATAYAWSNSGGSSATATFSPTASTTYTASVTVSGCQGVGTKAVTYFPSTAGTLPQNINFTGYTGGNLTTNWPGWFEALTTTYSVPSGTTSTWTNTNFANGASNMAALVTLTNSVKDDWMVSPSFTPTACTQFSFNFTVTVNNAATQASLRSMDNFDIMISNDCGVTWTAIQSYTSANTSGIPLTGTTQNIAIPSGYYSTTCNVAFRARSNGTGGSGSSAVNVFIDDIAIKNKPAIDIAVTSLTSPGLCVSGSAETVSVLLTNTGCNTINFSTDPIAVTTTVTLPGGGNVNLSSATTSTGTLATNATMTVTMVNGGPNSNGTLNMTTAGTYTITPQVTMTSLNDGDNTNNQITPSPTRTVLATATLPQTIDFTGYTGSNLNTVFPNWYEGGSGTTPTASNSASPWSNDFFVNTGSNVAAVINLYSTTASSSTGWIVGPKFNATGCSKVTFKLGLTVFGTTTASSLDANDLVQVRVSTDCGLTWTAIKTYNNTTPISNTGQAESVDLSAYSGQAIIVAFYATEGATATGDDDLFIEDVQIKNGAATDAGIVSLVTPTTSNTCGTASQSVTVKLKNYGCNSISNIPVTVNVTGIVPSTLNGTYTGTISPGATFDYVVGTIDMTTAGVYTFNGSTGISGDGDNSNDAFSAVSVTTINPDLTLTPASANGCATDVITLNATTTSYLAPTTVTQGSGVNSTSASTTSYLLGPNPVQSYYGGSREQMLFRASELTALGFVPGASISDIAIYLNTAETTRTLQNLKIKMGLTSVTDLSLAPYNSGLTTVYGPASFTPVAASANNFTLTSSFTWDGTSNLLVDISFSNVDGGGTGNTTATIDNTSFVSTYFYRNDNESVASTEVSGGSGSAWIYSERNRTRFTFGANVVPVWTSTGNLYTNIGATNSYTTGTGLNTVYAKNPVGSYTYNATVTKLGCSTSKSGTISIINLCGNVWLGGTTQWTSGGNWSYGTVPTACSDNVLIPTTPANGNNFPIIGTVSISVGDLTVQDGASIAVNNTKTLSVCGNFTGGTSTASSITTNGTGKLIFNGSGTQTFSGRASFPTLNINKTSGSVVVQNNSFFDVFTALELQSGALNNSGNTGGLFTLKSTAAAHAIFNDFSSGFSGTFGGTIYEERYYNATSANSYNQHYMGSPVSNADLAQLGAGGSSGAVTPTADCSETQLDAASVYGSVFTYNQATGAACPMASWNVVASGSNATPVQGYSVARTGSGTLTVHGTPNTASSYSLTGLANANWTKGTLQHPSATAFGSGWQLVANPYNATLDLSSATVSGFDNQIQIWNVINGTYQLATVIAPFQAFFVHKTAVGGGGIYTISGSNRVVTAQTFYAQNTPEQLSITATNNGTNLYDVATVGFNSNATDVFDAEFDANKLTGSIGRHNLYSMNNGYWLNKNILHSIAQTSTVDVGFEPGTSGSYTLAFEGLSSFDPTSYITLEDKKLNIFYDVRTGDYNFTSDAADDWNRFVLHFTPKAEIVTIDQNCSALGAINITQPGIANWTYTVTNNNNATISSGTLNQSTPVTVNAQAGTYTLTLIDANNYTVVKNITISGTQPVAATATVSSTAVQTTDDVTFTNTTANAATTAWDFGDGTTSANTTEVHAYTTAGTYTVTLTVTNADGCSSTTTQTVTVTEKSTTGLNNITNNKGISIWSSENKVFIDFSKQTKVEATIEIYNVLGQQLVNEKFGRSTVYTKSIGNLEAAYVIVKVKNDNEIITKKLLITNK